MGLLTLPRYMVDYANRKIPPRYGPLDEFGIPLFEPRLIRLSGPPVYHPIVIIQYGLAHYELALEGNSESEQTFLRCSRWIEDHVIEEPQHRFLVWPYVFPLRTPAVSAPWISGMAQGQAISLLLRAYLRSHSSKIEDVVHRAAQSFLYSVKDGGVVSKSINGSFFIEEVACSPSVHILNGSIYGLFGLYEYLQVFSDENLQLVFEKCLQGVEEFLPAFDMGWWSRYSLGVRWNIAPNYYHDIHIRQLRYLATLLNRPNLDLYASRWDKYRKASIVSVRLALRSVIELNINRVLGIAGLDRIKYRHIKGLED